jgi:hypothetical protein
MGRHRLSAKPTLLRAPAPPTPPTHLAPIGWLAGGRSGVTPSKNVPERLALLYQAVPTGDVPSGADSIARTTGT